MTDYLKFPTTESEKWTDIEIVEEYYSEIFWELSNLAMAAGYPAYPVLVRSPDQKRCSSPCKCINRDVKLECARIGDDPFGQSISGAILVRSLRPDGNLGLNIEVINNWRHHRDSLLRETNTFNIADPEIVSKIWTEVQRRLEARNVTRNYISCNGRSGEQIGP